jgi:hypothetical protein
VSRLDPDTGEEALPVKDLDPYRVQIRDRFGRFAPDPDAPKAPPPTRDEMRTGEQCRAFLRKMRTQSERGSLKPLARELCMPLSRLRGIASGFTFLEEMERRRISRFACLYDRGEVWVERGNTHLTPPECWARNLPSHVWKYAPGCAPKKRGTQWSIDLPEGSPGVSSLDDQENKP